MADLLRIEGLRAGYGEAVVLGLFRGTVAEFAQPRCEHRGCTAAGADLRQ